MKAAGKWRVVRNCCTSGNCIDCLTARKERELGYTPFGVPLRKVQIDGITKKRAEEIAHNWRDFKATAERMPA